MANTNHVVIQETDPSEFQGQLNETSEQHNVFATQTHVVNRNGQLYYVAVCFCRD